MDRDASCGPPRGGATARIGSCRAETPQKTVILRCAAPKDLFALTTAFRQASRSHPRRRLAHVCASPPLAPGLHSGRSTDSSATRLRMTRAGRGLAGRSLRWAALRLKKEVAEYSATSSHMAMLKCNFLDCQISIITIFYCTHYNPTYFGYRIFISQFFIVIVLKLGFYYCFKIFPSVSCSVSHLATCRNI